MIRLLYELIIPALWTYVSVVGTLTVAELLVEFEVFDR